MPSATPAPQSVIVYGSFDLGMWNQAARPPTPPTVEPKDREARLSPGYTGRHGKTDDVNDGSEAALFVGLVGLLLVFGPFAVSLGPVLGALMFCAGVYAVGLAYARIAQIESDRRSIEECKAWAERAEAYSKAKKERFLASAEGQKFLQDQEKARAFAASPLGRYQSARDAQTDDNLPLGHTGRWGSYQYKNGRDIGFWVSNYSKFITEKDEEKLEKWASSGFLTWQIPESIDDHLRLRRQDPTPEYPYGFYEDSGMGWIPRQSDPWESPVPKPAEKPPAPTAYGSNTAMSVDRLKEIGAAHPMRKKP